jgi:hypothetical protein
MRDKLDQNKTDDQTQSALFNPHNINREIMELTKDNKQDENI